MKNLHLVPANIMDLVEKINDKNIRENERNNYILRLEVTNSFISEALIRNKMTSARPAKRESLLR